MPCCPVNGAWAWTCHVEQGHYGHFANKPTWLYAVGVLLPEFIWEPGEQRIHPVALAKHGYEKARRIGMMAMIGGKDKTRSGTPAASFPRCATGYGKKMTKYILLNGPKRSGKSRCADAITNARSIDASIAIIGFSFISSASCTASISDRRGSRSIRTTSMR